MLLKLVEAARIAADRRYRPVLSDMESGAVADAMNELHESAVVAWRVACAHYRHTRPAPVSVHRRWPDARRLGWLPAFRLAWRHLRVR